MNDPMTMSTTATASLLLGDPLRVRNVSAMVRRRVPPADADDVTQTVLCDALAAPRLPSEPSELRRFLCVLARNKIADFHRRARKPSGDTTTCEEMPGAAAPVEARSLLARVMNGASPRDRETLEWLVRESEGEELKEIAADVGLPAPTVRKRVSRLRQALRAQWAHALLVILAVGGAAAAVKHSMRDDAVAIIADPAVDVGAGVIAAGQGKWRVAGGTRLVHTKHGVIDTNAIEIRISGRHIDVLGPLGAIPGARLSSTITSTRRVRDGVFELEMRDDHDHVQHATVVQEKEAMTITFRGGTIHGTARLVR